YAQRFIRDRLQLGIDRQMNVLARTRLHGPDHGARDRTAARVATDRRPTFLPAQHLVQLELEAAQRSALGVHPAEQLEGNVAVWVEALLDRLEVYTRQAVQALAHIHVEATRQHDPAPPRIRGTLRRT